jgi:alkyl hydroperoxide reductase subunit AhpC
VACSVLFSHPPDFVFVYLTEIITFSNAAAKFRAIVGRSADSTFCHLAPVGTNRKQGRLASIEIPLIGRLGAKSSTQFGCCICCARHDVRGTAIIHPDGVAQDVSYNQPNVGRNVDEALRLVKVCQFATTHGDVCPASGRRGTNNQGEREGEQRPLRQAVNKAQFPICGREFAGFRYRISVCSLRATHYGILRAPVPVTLHRIVCFETTQFVS